MPHRDYVMTILTAQDNEFQGPYPSWMKRQRNPSAEHTMGWVALFSIPITFNHTPIVKLGEKKRKGMERKRGEKRRDETRRDETRREEKRREEKRREEKRREEKRREEKRREEKRREEKRREEKRREEKRKARMSQWQKILLTAIT